MAYHDTDLGIVLAAFRAKLIADAVGFTADNCRYYFRQPGTIPQPGGPQNVFAEIYPAEAPYDEALFAGGGSHQTTDQGQISVEVFSIMPLDPSGRQDLMLTDPTRGLGHWGKVILKAFAGVMLSAVYSAVTCDILRQPLSPVGRGAPGRIPEEEAIGSLMFNFSCMFDWDLS